eukprot:1764345-Rhodomonas_salina.1
MMLLRLGPGTVTESASSCLLAPGLRLGPDHDQAPGRGTGTGSVEMSHGSGSRLLSLALRLQSS